VNRGATVSAAAGAPPGSARQKNSAQEADVAWSERLPLKMTTFAVILQ